MYLAYQWYKRNKARKAEEAALAQEQAAGAEGQAPATTTIATDEDGRVVSTVTADSVEGISGNEKTPAVAAPVSLTPKKTVETEEEKAEKKRQRIYRWKLVLALFPAAFLASADLTIVSTALTTIASDFSMLLLCLYS
jgi:hypothetical protein